MEIIILLFGYVITLNVTLLDAMLSKVFNQGLEFYGFRTKHPDVRPGDFVSVYLRGLEPLVTGGVFTGYLEGPVENHEALPRGATRNRLFARLSHGLFYADLVHRPSITEDLGGVHRCFIQGPEKNDEERDEVFFSAVLSPKKPTGPSDVWIEKHTLPHPYTPYMWGVNLEQCRQMYIPVWAFKNNVERGERIYSSQH